MGIIINVLFVMIKTFTCKYDFGIEPQIRRLFVIKICKSPAKNIADFQPLIHIHYPF